MKRFSLNPVLSAKDIPYPATLVFNAGVCKWQGKYVMLFRNDYGQTEESWRKTQASGQWPHLATNIGIARSRDGVHWTAGPKPVFQMRDDTLDDDNPAITTMVKRLLPMYLDKAMKSLSILEPMAKNVVALEALRALTLFCAERVV